MRIKSERAPYGYVPDNMYFWRKETKKRTLQDGTEREYVAYKTRSQIDVAPVVPLVESALKTNEESQDAMLQRLGIDASKWSRWQSGEYTTCNIDTLDKLCIELGYSLTAVYDE